MGRVGNVWSLSVLTAMLWFCGALGMALDAIFAGLSAGEHERVVDSTWTGGQVSGTPFLGITVLGSYVDDEEDWQSSCDL
jgi:hypothetical protein